MLRSPLGTMRHTEGAVSRQLVGLFSSSCVADVCGLSFMYPGKHLTEVKSLISKTLDLGQMLSFWSLCSFRFHFCILPLVTKWRACVSPQKPKSQRRWWWSQWRRSGTWVHRHRWQSGTQSAEYPWRNPELACKHSEACRKPACIKSLHTFNITFSLTQEAQWYIFLRDHQQQLSLTRKWRHVLSCVPHPVFSYWLLLSSCLFDSSSSFLYWSQQSQLHWTPLEKSKPDERFNYNRHNRKGELYFRRCNICHFVHLTHYPSSKNQSEP